MTRGQPDVKKGPFVFGAMAPESINSQRVEQVITTLITQGICDSIAVERAVALAEEGMLNLPQALVQLGHVAERTLANTFSSVLSLSLARPERYPDTPILPNCLHSRFLRAARAVPAAIESDILTLVVVDPLDDFTRDAVGLATGLQIKLEVGVPIELEAALERLYPAEMVGGQPSPVKISEDDTERLKDLASEAPVIKIVNQIIAKAVETMASDIHIEPFEDRLRIRYRCDGELREAESYPHHLSPAITSRLKILAKLDIAERRLPQDGRIRMNLRGQDVVLRIATAPSLHGEIVVLRILDRSAVMFDFKSQGHSEQVIARLDSALAIPNGIILVTGPTGSGKTTTLYTALLSLNAIERKIITVEDPIEYQLPGINQIQIKPKINLNFANVLRSIVRLDPDVIMIGEIRDLETAEIAARSALTGHLVLSTLHTNSAASAITRLRDMGLEDYLVAAVLRGILSQRLVRRLCDLCKKPGSISSALQNRFHIETDVIWHATGCPACRDTGYSGRRAIAEFLTPDPNLERLFFAHADQQQLEEAAVVSGMQNMARSGMAAVANGETTIEEILRVVKIEW